MKNESQSNYCPVCFPPFSEATPSTVWLFSSGEGERANEGSNNLCCLTPSTYAYANTLTGKFFISPKENGKLRKLTNIQALESTAFGSNALAAEMIRHGFVWDCFGGFFLTSLVSFCFFNYKRSTGKV